MEIQELEVTLDAIGTKENNLTVLSPRDSRLGLPEWLTDHKEWVQDRLRQAGALLFRGFAHADGPEDFQEAFSIVCGDPLLYQFRTSPRHEVAGRVYTSTDHPSDQTINMHTECSYASHWPVNLAFYCHQPSLAGGETPIANEQKVIDALPIETLEKFRSLGVQYERNFSRVLGLTWQKAFQTEDKGQAEEFMETEGMEYEWQGEDYLKIKWSLPAFQQHPHSGETVWFNHMYFGHRAHFDPSTLQLVPEKYLPFLTSYGDGSPVEDDTIRRLKESYLRNRIVFPWEKNDLLLLDNMRWSHGRNPFIGERRILVAMGCEMAMGDR